MNSIMACDEAREESEFLSALNAFLVHFVHKTLKAEQVECSIVCHGRDVLAVLPTGFGKSAIYQLIPKVRSDEGLTLETSAFQIFHGGNFTFITSFDKTKFLF